MGRPSKEDFRNMLEKGKLLNNPVTMRDYQIAENIYGKDLGVIKGKTVRVKPKQVVIDTTSVIHEKQNVVLAVDIMHLTSLNFLITVARNIRFITATFLPDRRKKTIVHAMRQVIGIYRGKGHQVTDVEFTETEERPIHTILADNEFVAIQAEMEEDGINVNTTAKEEHVPEVERQNRVIKERARAIIQTMPYAGIPRKIRIALIQYVVYWLNNIPKSGQEHSPRDLILGEQKLDYEAICRIPFGAYVQVHDDPTITNTMQSRTTGAISLGATGNAQGTHRFFSLKTGEVIVRRTWTLGQNCLFRVKQWINYKNSLKMR